MASTSRGPSTSSKSKPKSKPISPALLEQFCAVTGADESTAQQMLTLCEGNLEMAVNMHVDSNLLPGDSESSAAIAATSDDTTNVRAPIPPTQGILVEEAYNFGFRGGRKRPSSSVFDGFRDFQAETRWQEQELGNLSAEAIRKRKTLEDLFRPPLDLIHRGTFESARDVGQTTNRWLMVNVQNGQEFACQILNRDVWSNQSVKSLVKEHFVFWQVYHDSNEGMRFNQFYKVEEFPYVGVLDPRTGEKLMVWNGNEAAGFCESILDFLSEHPSPDGTTKSVTAKKQKVESIVDISEDQQIEAAIKASLEESKSNKPDEESCSSDNESGSIDLETFDSDDAQSSPDTSSVPEKLKNGDRNSSISSNSNTDSITIKHEVLNNQNDVVNNNIEEQNLPIKSNCEVPIMNNCCENHHGISEDEDEAWKPYLGSETDPKSELLLRFPEGNKKQVSFSCSTKFKALLIYIASQGFPESDYELVTTFPKRQLNSSSPESTLKELGLYPRETIYVQLKNS